MLIVMLVEIYEIGLVFGMGGLIVFSVFCGIFDEVYMMWWL